MLHMPLRKSEWQQDAQYWLGINPEKKKVLSTTRYQHAGQHSKNLLDALFLKCSKFQDFGKRSKKVKVK